MRGPRTLLTDSRSAPSLLFPVAGEEAAPLSWAESMAAGISGPQSLPWGGRL